ncbi:MAG TPA: hypothetical protein P5567_13285 [Kiritimatiellia bacterium]|nr:hypothetical protein [Kiritimatiellia bacterium]HRZ13417.1 hypothetical protein [Kiritimatiellia bacterium]HSA18943.1 hypothetical protein [Kiritimatiellia bacterium]
MTSFFHRAALLMAVLSLAAGAAHADLVASDNADNDPYPSGWNPGDNAGSGFTAWVSLQAGSPGSMYVENLAPLDGLYSWGLSGTYAVGRGLSNSLAAGQWNILASHGSDVGSFCGFNLRTSTDDSAFDTDEILRFGINYGEEFDATRIYFSTNGGADYAYIDLGDADLRDSDLEYNVSWSTVSGSFTLGVRNGEDYEEVTADLPSDAAVAMFGAGIFEASLDERMTFDDYGVEAIPEPGALVTLVLGCGFIQWFMYRRLRRAARLLPF